MFPDREYGFNGLKVLTEKMTEVIWWLASLTHVRVMIDHCAPKLKISHWFFWSVSYSLFSASRLHLLSKKYLEQAFCCIILLTHIHLMRRLSSVVNLIDVTALLLTSCLHIIAASKKMFNKNTNYFRRLESAFHWICYLKFSFKLVNFSKSYAPKQVGVFFWIQCRLRRHKLVSNNWNNL